jgi:Lon protease-like protein
VEIPLFPIGEVVLLPGMGLPIYVFEPRYRELLGRVRASGEPFGIPCVLPTDATNQNTADSDTPESDRQPAGMIASVGTLAHLTDVEYNPDGTAQIMVVGGERYRILSINDNKYPYAVANVELSPLEPSNPTWVRSMANEVVERFLSKVKDRFGDIRDEVPEEPILKASFVAANLRLPGPQGQRILEARNLLERFEIISDYLGVEQRTLN